MYDPCPPQHVCSQFRKEPAVDVGCRIAYTIQAMGSPCLFFNWKKTPIVKASVNGCTTRGYSALFSATQNTRLPAVQAGCCHGIMIYGPLMCDPWLVRLSPLQLKNTCSASRLLWHCMYNQRVMFVYSSTESNRQRWMQVLVTASTPRGLLHWSPVQLQK